MPSRWRLPTYAVVAPAWPDGPLILLPKKKGSTLPCSLNMFGYWCDQSQAISEKSGRLWSDAGV